MLRLSLLQRVLYNMSYQPPLDELLFLLRDVHDWNDLFCLPEFEHADVDLAREVLQQGARFAAECLAPVNVIGDEQGAIIKDNRVQLPKAICDVYAQYVEDGWPGIDLPLEWHGQQLPLIVQVAFSEMLNGANVAFGMLPIMLRAGGWLLLEHGEKWLVEKVLPHWVKGDWGATICISEPQAGSDVGRIRTLAQANEAGEFLLTGNKIFISYGDHNLTEQIVHLVLARKSGSPQEIDQEINQGTRGLSLFAVPRLDFDTKKNNGVSVSRVEKKMGLKGSPTCALNFESAKGYQIGEDGRGLTCLFTMVKLMRLEVAVQGVAVGQASLGAAWAYAAERTQGGKASEPPTPIVNHPDVRRRLFDMQARINAVRALVLEAAKQMDLARAAPTTEQRRAAAEFADFLLPICKAWASDTGFDVAAGVIEVFGGHGYVSDAGVEQYARDSRVMSIYEGTNGIQAIDLVMRKILRDEGRVYSQFVAAIRDDLISAPQSIIDGVSVGLTLLDDATQHLLNGKNEDDALAGATDYLRLVALVAGAWMQLRIYKAASSDAKSDEFRRRLVDFYVAYVLPETATHAARVKLGTVMT